MLYRNISYDDPQNYDVRTYLDCVVLIVKVIEETQLWELQRSPDPLAGFMDLILREGKRESRKGKEKGQVKERERESFVRPRF